MLILSGCAPWNPHIVLENPSDCDRDEIVEIPFSDINAGLQPNEMGIFDSFGAPVPFQLTSDSLIIFRAKLNAHSSSSFSIMKGINPVGDTLACGRLYPEHNDDVAWENDRIAFRAFGPAPSHTEEMDFGYDVWVKNVSRPVVRERYSQATDSLGAHKDCNNGCDCYSSGPTLGCGATAIISDGAIVYPPCYYKYELLDNGPLRFKTKLTLRPKLIDNRYVEETRIITLDAGSQLNKTEVSFSNVTSNKHIIAGLAIHDMDPSTHFADLNRRFIAHADPTSDTLKTHGTIFTSVLFPLPADSLTIIKMDNIEANARETYGHIAAHATYVPETTFTYYWGAAWSEYGISTMEDWIKYLKEKTECIDHPIIVHIER